LTAGATANLDVRLSDILDMRVAVEQTWVATSSTTTGIAINLYPGVGSKDPKENPNSPIPNVLTNPATGTYSVSTVPVFAGNYAPVTSSTGASAVVNPSPGSSNQTTVTIFYLNTVISIWPNWVRMQFINQDQSNSVNLQILADI
jgi:hypothetical protein